MNGYGIADHFFVVPGCLSGCIRQGILLLFEFYDFEHAHLMSRMWCQRMNDFIRRVVSVSPG